MKYWQWSQHFFLNNAAKGVIQHWYKKGLVGIKGSSVDGSYVEENILAINGKYWQSKPIENSNFTVSLKGNHKLILSHFSLLSCVTYDCVFSLNISGSNDGKIFDHICSINEDKKYYYKIINNSTCTADKPYSYIRFTHVGINDHNNYTFPIHYLELYGFMDTTYTIKGCQTFTIKPFTIIFLLFIK